MASTRQRPRSRRISFLDLPGELRNNFYKYYFEDDFRCEFVAQDHALLDKFTCGETSPGAITSDHLTQILLKTVRMSRAMGHYMRVHGLQTKWSTSLCPLLLLCKLIHHEVIALFYKKTTMVFAGPRRITNTLQIVPKIHLALITKLDLHYSTYGSPSLFEHSAWQVVHTLSWEKACGELTEQLNNVQELQIWIKVNHRPLIFELDQDWLSPIIRFRRLAPVLLKVQIHLITSNNYPRIAPLTRQQQAILDVEKDFHTIFAKAISDFIVGRSEEEAMRIFDDVWDLTDVNLRSFLSFR
ncbi:hypothetical protein BS50DRAFT_496550 [Corynespora cassiicola Philippines]|uniref:DUF7730 domain-containing protein n=1 Tax=Corynespora cassiicola Philippines TaxID=1448308 RepID=A0A2T2NK13_CORCC|nr:hypothetical protein BS50DRAFT_496550 [Corynespora cassiicola Philippines]